jgi:tetratricopeptide (TPR) repeat protein
MEQVHTGNNAEQSGIIIEPYSLALVNSAGAANLSTNTLVSLIGRIAPAARRTGKWFLWHKALKKLVDEITIQRVVDRQIYAVIYNEIGVSLRWLGDVSASREALLRAIEIFGESGDFVSQGETLLEIGQLEQTADNLPAAFEAYQRSEAVARRANLTDLLRRALNGLSGLALDQNRPDQARELAKEAFHLIPDEPSGECLSLLSIAYLKQENFKDSLEMGKQALKVFEEEADYPQQARMHFRLGMVYYANGQPDFALQHLGQGLGMMRAMGDALGQSRLLTNLGAVCSAGEQFEKAEAIWYDAIALQEEIGDEVGMFSTWQGLGNLYQRMGRIQKAEEAFQKASDIASNYLDLPTVLARLDPTSQTWLSGELGPPQPPETRPGHPPN